MKRATHAKPFSRTATPRIVRASAALLVIAALICSVGAVESASAVGSGAVGVGVRPFGVAIDAAAGSAYVANSTADSVSVINLATKAVTATIALPAGSYPAYPAVNTATHTVYAPNYNTQSVSVINGVSNTLTTTISVPASGSYPYMIAVDSVNNFVFVANGTNGIAKIDGATNLVVATFAVASGVMNVVFDAINNTLYASGGSVTYAVNASTGVTIAPISAQGGQALAIDTVSNLIYAAGGPNISVIDGTTNTVSSTIAYSSVGAMTVDSSAHVLYVNPIFTGSPVTLIDGVTHATITTIAAGFNPHGMAIDEGRHALYAADISSSNVYVAEAPTLTAATLPTASLATSYQFQVIATGFSAPTFSLTGGSLAPGLSLDPITGLVTGIPTASGTFGFTITATNGIGSPAVQGYSITVAARVIHLPVVSG